MVTMASVALLLGGLIPAQLGEVSFRQGPVIKVSKAPSSWRVGMPVVILWKLSAKGEVPAAIAHGAVERVGRGEAVVRLTQDSSGVTLGAKVVARFVYEQINYGGRRSYVAQSRPRGAAVTTSKSSYRLEHRPPSVVKWNQKLWFELTLRPPVEAVEVMLRLGVESSYQSVTLKAGKDGYWRGAYTMGKPQPKVSEVQYYLAVKDGDQRQVIKGSPATPMRLRIKTQPRTSPGRVVSHYPVDRWNQREKMKVSVQIDSVYTEPKLHYRQAGGGRYQVLPMASTGEQAYEATLPADWVVRPYFYYYLSALDENGSRHPVFRKAGRPHRVKVVRARLLDGTKQRNQTLVSFDWINRGVDGDASQRKTIRYDRAFFPFLLARIGFILWQEERLSADVTGGEAGLEFRIKEFVSLTADAHTLAFGSGSAFGYRLGMQIGDEAGAYIGGSYGFTSDLSDWSAVGESLSFNLVVPVARRYQLAGVFESDDYFASEKDLRLFTRFSARFGKHTQLSGSAGMATRGGEKSGVYLGGSVGLGF